MPRPYAGSSSRTDYPVTTVRYHDRVSELLDGRVSRSTVRILAFTGLLFALLTAVLFPVIPRTLRVSAGDISAETVRAPQNLSYDSEIVRAQLQDQAVRSVREIVTYNVSAKSDQLARLTDTVNRMGSARDTPGL